MKWRNQLLALFCLAVFLAFGVFYFRYWVVQKPFGIILFIGEGLGSGRLAAARIYSAGADTPLTLDSLPYTAFLKNYSLDFATPDEAAAATALATGVKVKNGAIGVDAAGKSLMNMLELARESGRMTGLVTNGLLTNVTPASFYAHASKQDHPEFARVLTEDAKIDLVLGGGSAAFVPETNGGHRSDGRDLLSELQDAGYDLVRSLEELEEVPRWRRPRLFGLFSMKELASADDDDAQGDEPSLADMVRRAIELLQFNSGGYLLVVDAGLMRKAAQENDGQRTLLETIELDRAVSVALRYAGAKSTILVCGDVAIGGLNLNGLPPREQAGPALLESRTAVIPWLTWATGPNGVKNPPTSTDPISPAEKLAEPLEAPAHIREPAAFYAESALHTADDVSAFGSGLGADALHGTLESTAIFDIIRDNL